MLVSTSGRLGCELYMPGRKHADAAFAALMKDKGTIEAELGELDWQDLPDRKACRIAQYREAQLEDREQWAQLYPWMKERAEAFKTAFAERLKTLDLPEERDVTALAATTHADAPAPGIGSSDGAAV